MCASAEARPVVVGFFLLPLALPILVKFLALAPISLAVIVGLYLAAVRPLSPMRFLFGRRSEGALSRP